PNRDRQGKPEPIAERAPRDITPNLARDEEHPEGGACDQRRRRDEDAFELQPLGRLSQNRMQRIGPPAALESFPNEQGHEHHHGAKDGALVPEIEALLSGHRAATSRSAAPTHRAARPRPGPSP